jgi:hypothetical protein
MTDERRKWTRDEPHKQLTKFIMLSKRADLWKKILGNGAKPHIRSKRIGVSFLLFRGLEGHIRME